ncbi:MAG TPA: cell division protein FtsL [Gaiellaceae bacterium]|nr:cell division protein FtsL [Gaiellaceae bacterium]
MSAVAHPERIGRRVASGRGRRTAERSRPRARLLGGGVVWIVVLAALLAGVVAVNVAVLRLNLELDGVSRERSQLKADLASVRAELSKVAATAQIERTATEELGLEAADPDDMVYVTLPPR